MKQKGERFFKYTRILKLNISEVAIRKCGSKKYFTLKLLPRMKISEFSSIQIVVFSNFIN